MTPSLFCQIQLICPKSLPDGEYMSPKASKKQPEDWKIFQGTNTPHDGIENLPSAPSWRPFGRAAEPGVNRRKHRGETFQARPEEIEAVNAALYLRRPLLVTGKPGTGKSSLAYAVAHELKLGEVLYWPITTRTTLKDGLYTYDAIGRLQEVKQQDVRETAKDSGFGTLLDRDNPQQIANYITLGPLGTALVRSDRPRVLIIDEIDKSDIDLPNDLLTIFEEGQFEIPELARLELYRQEQGIVGQAISEQSMQPITVRVRTAYSDHADEVTAEDRVVEIEGGRVACTEFPLVILTSNEERDFPPPFLRRCLRLAMREPNREELERIVTAHLDGCDISNERVQTLIDTFLKKRQERKQLATDQLLNALFMVIQERELVGSEKKTLVERLLAALDQPLPVKSTSPRGS